MFLNTLLIYFFIFRIPNYNRILEENPDKETRDQPEETSEVVDFLQVSQEM